MWSFKDTCWESDEVTQTFQLKRLYDKEYTSKSFSQLDLIIGAKRHESTLDGLNCSSGYFPQEFTFCPFCKARLIAIENKRSSPWLPPYGNNTGLKITPESLKLNLQIPLVGEGQVFSLPSESGRFSFCSVYASARQTLLFALQRDAGKLSVYQSEKDNHWIELEGVIGGDDLPSWSWSIATDAIQSGLAIPTNTGPVWVTVDWTSQTLEIDRGDGRSIGGVARLGVVLLAPVMLGNSFYIKYRADGDTSWSECKTNFDEKVVAPNLSRNQNQEQFLGIPIIDESRNVVYWPSRGGYIKVIGTIIPSELSWEFHTWEQDDEYPATALIELGPPYKKIGSRTGFWQLCEDYDPNRRGGGVVNKIIKIDGDVRTDFEELEYGQFLTTGRASFGWLYDNWTEIDKINPNDGEHTELRYPLLQFGEKGPVLLAKVLPWNGRPDVGFFSDVFSPNEKKSVWIRFVIEGPSIPEIALVASGVDGRLDTPGSVFKLSLKHLPEISVFVHDSLLYIYLPDDNKCFGWQLNFLD